MAQIKCKMCGGTLNIASSDNVVECEFCGTKQTVPSLDNEKIAILHNRANTLRLKNDFVKAMLTYENIIEENPIDAEAHWGLVLCRYGIEYVDDPKTGKKIPTCHRTQYKSIFDDVDYQAAIEYCDVLARQIYQDQAEEINRIQKEILAISQQEDPYDVFICYKELDEAGKRTIDSVMAQELYDNLLERGYKVFFSKVSLESKLGTQYEPHIFAALNSAKVMVVVGTKPEYFSSPWVKNEWNRFISLMEENKNKYIIPCFKDMDVYELPDELVIFQCQDMNQVGFFQDITRGIDKIFGRKHINIDFEDTNNSNYVDALFERCDMLLSNNLFSKTADTLNLILNKDSKNVKAYLYLLLVDLKLTKLEDLDNHKVTIDYNSNFQCALKFANEEELEKLEKIRSKINENVENVKKKKIYSKALTCKMDNKFEEACVLFKSISEYSDAEEMSKECLKLAQNRVYEKAVKLYESMDYKTALNLFKKIVNYEDSKEKIDLCLKEINEQNKKRNRKNFIIGGCVSFAIVLLILLFTLFIPLINRNSAINHMEDGNYYEASNVLDSYDGFLNYDELREVNDILSNCTDRYLLIDALYSNGFDVQVDIVIDDKNKQTLIINNQLNEILLSRDLSALYIPRDGYTLERLEVQDVQLNLSNGNRECTFILMSFWNGNKYNISYKNVDSVSNLPMTYVCGQPVEVPNPSKYGYVFLGWQEEGTDEVIKDLIIQNVFGSKTYVAVWEVTQPMIIFDTNGGTSLENLELNFGDEIITEMPEKEGYTFMGWTPELPETMPNEVLYVEAVWEANSYAVILDVNGGIELNDDLLTVTYYETFLLPTPKNSEKQLKFDGWYNGTIKIESGIWCYAENMTLVAKWIEVPLVYEENGVKYANIGKYPQSVVTDEAIIAELNKITKTNSLGYIEFNGEEYKKLTGAPYLGNDYKFNNGDKIIKGTTYYFLVEPIKWRVLQENNGTYKLMSEYVIEKMNYYGSESNRTIDGETVYPNNYMYSNVRAWLNGYDGSTYNVSNYTNKGFYDIAFDDDDRTLINTTLVDNSVETTNSYNEDSSCSNTNDKIYLLSAADVKNRTYGFNTNYFNEDQCRKAVTTDYIRCKGIWINTASTLYGHCHWLLRSPYSMNKYYNITTVYIDTTFNNNSYVSQGYYGVRPAMDVTIEHL